MPATFTVWKNFASVGENCLRRADGDYVGLKTGRVYSKTEHRHSEQKRAQIVSVDARNLTGMTHLYANDRSGKQNRFEWKQKFVGCLVTVEEAHQADGVRVYRCRELNEYFSARELKIL